MTTTVLRGGTVVDQHGSQAADVVVDDLTGTVLEVGPSGSVGADADRELDAGSCHVAPGFVDLNVHLCEPGDEAAETIESGSRAAARGGYTAIVAMPDTDPVVDSAAVVSEVLALSKTALCEIVPAATVTVGRDGTALAPLGELADLGVRLFSDAGRSVQDAAVVRNALDYAAGVGERAGARLRLAQACRLEALADAAVMNEGEWSARLGLPGQPAAAEELMVARDLALARLTGSWVHLQQISTAGSVGLIREAKAAQVPVTAEVSPHHLVLDESACATFDTNTKVQPPLRTRADMEALRAAVLDGTIDAIATDHRPHTVDVKEQPFDEAPSGIVGLETALAVLLTDLDAPFEAILPALSWQPAEIAAIGDRHGGPIEPGRPANLIVVDPTAEWTVDPGRSASRSANTPFAGRTLVGRVRHTIHGGEAVIIDGEATR